MRKIVFCFLVCLLGLGQQAHSQCRVVAPDAKEWIESNREKIAKMTRAEWNELDEGYKWIVFSELSAKQKHNFFQLKIEQVKDDFEWNEAEKKHIDKLLQLFKDNPDLYSEEKRPENSPEIETFIENWVSYAKDTLKWSPKLLQGMVASCNDLLDKEGNIKVTSKIETKPLDIGGSTTD